MTSVLVGGQEEGLEVQIKLQETTINWTDKNRLVVKASKLVIRAWRRTLSPVNNLQWLHALALTDSTCVVTKIFQ